MTTDLNSLDAPAFARFLFDREVGPMKAFWSPAWSWSCDPVRALDLTSVLLENAGTLVRPYSPDQIEQGFWFLLGSSFNLSGWLWDEALPLDARLRCVASMPHVFRDVFRDVETESICHMWWDLVVTYPFECGAAMRDGVLAALADVLALESRRCQRAALHGLGHLEHARGPGLIDAWVDAHPGLDAGMLGYAAAAKEGRVQ
jgi:hypothetical protein